MTGVTVVADFRTRDLVVGGQVAPFAPIYHQAIFKDIGYPLAIVNIGGIANISYLSSKQDVLGYDTGPGNCLMDAMGRRHQGVSYDAEGAWAKQGTVIEPLLNSLLQDSFFYRTYPKSAGKEYFSLHWLLSHCKSDYSAVDIQATLLQLTATTIADNIKGMAHCPRDVLICGGGAHNISLLNALQKLLPSCKITPTSEFSVYSDFLEAMMFAWLAGKNTKQHIIRTKKYNRSKKQSYFRSNLSCRD